MTSVSLEFLARSLIGEASQLSFLNVKGKDSSPYPLLGVVLGLLGKRRNDIGIEPIEEFDCVGVLVFGVWWNRVLRELFK